MELTVEKRVNDSVNVAREQTRKELEEQVAVRIREKEATISDMEKRLGEAAKREQDIKQKEAALAQEKESLAQKAAELVAQERSKIAAEEAKKAKLALSSELDNKSKELADLQQVLKERSDKLAEAQKAQADLIRKERELDDAKREMELTVEKRVQESIGKTREQAKKEAEEQLGLKVMEREETIRSMQKQIEELKRKAEQGSQQLQGEVQELQLEQILQAKFPQDRIEPVPKGEHGGDLLQRVIMPTGAVCGTILWESKRTKNWSDGWLPKLREDQRRAKAEVAIIVSGTLPKGIDTFDQVVSVWITHPKVILPVALSLRQTLIEVHCARQASEGQQTKMEMVYQYLTGPKFKLRVHAIVEAFSSMASDLQKEKKAIMKQWAKREGEITRVVEATVGMYGELQGIVGKTLQEIEGLDFKTLGDGNGTGD
ncbi:MAG: DUF2130 domain-containing protein [Phycisphaerae bacterium]